MARGWSGPGKRPVSTADRRSGNLRELLLALSSPGCCIVLGAGASFGVVPMRAAELATLAIKILREERQFQALTAREKARVATPELHYVVGILRQVPRGAWDRVITDLMSPGQASYILNAVFTPTNIPHALIDVYDTFEPLRGSIVSYNYDAIAGKQKCFPVFYPHGQVSPLFSDDRTARVTGELARELHLPIPNDWHLPVVETDQIRARTGYRETVHAWRTASSVVLVGFGFGGGADAISFEDFGRAVAPRTPVHVVCPPPENRDLVRQIGHALRGRQQALVYGQAFRWRDLAEAFIWLLSCLGRQNVRSLVGMEHLVARAHDDGGIPPWARSWRTHAAFI